MTADSVLGILSLVALSFLFLWFLFSKISKPLNDISTRIGRAGQKMEEVAQRQEYLRDAMDKNQLKLKSLESKIRENSLKIEILEVRKEREDE